MYENYTSEIFPPEPLVKPNDRRGVKGNLNLPAGTTVFSADNHIELSEDIWQLNFPANMKDKAPKIWQSNKGATHISVGGQSLLPEAYAVVFEPYGLVPGFVSGKMDARMQDLTDEGIDKELDFPNAIMALLNYPDFEVRELCFRIYNQYIASLQEKCPGRFYGVGLINWWDAAGTRRTLAEAKKLGLKTFMLPLNPGPDPETGERIDYTSTRMTPVWEAIEEAGLPVSHHIGENVGAPAEFNRMSISFMHSVAPFRDMFARYIFGGILDRHPSLQVGWFEGGINWVASAMQDAEHTAASYWHMDNLKLKHEPHYYWRQHMCASFMLDPLGLEMIDRLGADKVMWSSDYPHIESTFGFSRNSLNHVAKVVGRERAPAVVGGNIARFLKM